jgi:flagellar biogenesis protein FliO
MMQRARATVLFGLLLLALPARALDPAGGPPDPDDRIVSDDSEHNPKASPRPTLDAPDASVEDHPAVEDRTWLTHEAPAPSEVGSGIAAPNPVLTLLALAIVLALGGGALWLQRRKRQQSPLTSAEARLTLISSTRVGPKAFAVSAEVGGRVLLLGVTDHSVTNLGWLDPPELDAMEPQAVAPSARDELPDDYPGSALRAASSSSSSLTSSGNLRRFQEVLRGALPDTPALFRSPSSAAPRAEPTLRSAPLAGGSDAASTLAALTEDVLGGNGLPNGVPASLRRKRQRRQEQLESLAPAPNLPARVSSIPTRAASIEAPAPHPAPRSDAGIEGQVAGLRAAQRLSDRERDAGIR